MMFNEIIHSPFFMIANLCTSLLFLALFIVVAKKYSRVKNEIHNLKSENNENDEMMSYECTEKENQLKAMQLSKRQASAKVLEAFNQGGSVIEMVTTAFADTDEIILNIQASLDDICDKGTQTSAKAQNTQRFISQLHDSIKDLTKVSEDVSKIDAILEGINSKSSMLNEIAMQAKMLSFNSSVEAARTSGAQGRAFAIIAKDISQLANFSTDISSEIQEMINDGSGQIQEINKDIEARITSSSNTTNKVIKRTKEIAEGVCVIGEVSETASTISHENTKKIYDIKENSKTNLESLNKTLSEVMGVISGVKIVDVEPIEASKELGDYDLVIDVRRPKEYNDELGHIGVSELICLQENFEERIDKYPRNSKILFVCRSGGRSARAARIAQSLGFENIYNLGGGMLRWKEKHLNSETLPDEFNSKAS
jgi:rhodanese-related sulfurtransferase